MCKVINENSENDLCNLLTSLFRIKDIKKKNEVCK